MQEKIVMCVIALGMALVFLAIGFWALKSQAPVHFWSGSTVRPEEVRDIASYNKANGIMWLCYGGMYLAVGLLALYSASLSGVLLGVLAFGGIPVLVMVYSRICKKYKD